MSPVATSESQIANPRRHEFAHRPRVGTRSGSDPKSTKETSRTCGASALCCRAARLLPTLTRPPGSPPWGCRSATRSTPRVTRSVMGCAKPAANWRRTLGCEESVAGPRRAHLVPAANWPGFRRPPAAGHERSVAPASLIGSGRELRGLQRQLHVGIVKSGLACLLACACSLACLNRSSAVSVSDRCDARRREAEGSFPVGGPTTGYAAARTS